MQWSAAAPRWRVSWNSVQPEGRRKERPEFLELSHKLNLGNLRY